MACPAYKVKEMRTSTSLNLLCSGQKAQGAKYSPKTYRPHPFLHHLAPALPVAPMVFLWPQDSKWGFFLNPQSAISKHLKWCKGSAAVTREVFLSQLYTLYALQCGMRVLCEKRLLDYLIQLWKHKLPKLRSFSNTAFWKRTLEQTNPRSCQLTNH